MGQQYRQPSSNLGPSTAASGADRRVEDSTLKDNDLLLIKADVTKAHRRIKVLRKLLFQLHIYHQAGGGSEKPLIGFLTLMRPSAMQLYASLLGQHS